MSKETWLYIYEGAPAATRRSARASYIGIGQVHGASTNPITSTPSCFRDYREGTPIRQTVEPFSAPPRGMYPRPRPLPSTSPSWGWIRSMTLRTRTSFGFNKDDKMITNIAGTKTSKHPA